MNTTNTYTVYTMTPRGSFSQKYEGTDEGAALKAYNRLVDANKPRCLNKSEDGGLLFKRQMSYGFPE